MSKLISQQPLEQVSSLLEEFVRERCYVPAQAQNVAAIDELPLCLQALAQNSSCTNAQWGAWTLDHRIWFVIAQQVHVSTAQSGEIALRIAFYDHDAVLAANGIWVRGATRKWTLHSVLDDEQGAVANEPNARYRQFALAS